MELIYFYMPGCPYCRRADEIIRALQEERPEYRRVPLRRIDETRERALAGQYDYWYVPSFFLNGEKRYEANPQETPAQMRAAIERTLSAALQAMDG